MPRPPSLFVPTLRRKERERLRKAAKSSPQPKLRDRCRAILWSEERRSVSEIARLLSVDISTAFLWIKDYLRFGFAGLVPQPISGRPPAVDVEGEAVLRKALAKNPRDMGYGFTRWTLPLLAEHLYATIHSRVSPDVVRSALRRLRYRYKRPKLSLKHKQNRRDVRRARQERDAAKKRPLRLPSDLSSSIKTSASSISIPA